jgi:hypothetical protein
MAFTPPIDPRQYPLCESALDGPASVVILSVMDAEMKSDAE